MKLHMGNMPNGTRETGKDKSRQEEETSPEDQWDTQQSLMWRTMTTTTASGTTGRTRANGVTGRTTTTAGKELTARKEKANRGSLVALCCDRLKLSEPCSS